MMQPSTSINLWGVPLVKACKAKQFVPDFFKGHEIVQVIPGRDWEGGREYVGKAQDAVCIHGMYYDKIGSQFVMGENHWILVE